MKIHKVHSDSDDIGFSYCGMDVADGVYDGYRKASANWITVTCKRCLKTRPHHPKTPIPVARPLPPKKWYE